VLRNAGTWLNAWMENARIKKRVKNPFIVNFV